MIVFLLISCSQEVLESGTQKPTEFNFAEEYLAAETLLDDFIEPYDLCLINDDLAIIDAGAGELWRWSEASGDLNLTSNTLERPTKMACLGEEIVIFDEAEQHIVHLRDSGPEIILDRISDVGDMHIVEDDLFVTVPELGQLFTINLYNEEEKILSELDAPYGLASNGNILFIGTQGDQKLWEYDSANTTITELVTLNEVPYGLEHNGTQLCIATRSTRWPYGGWIYSYDNALVALSDSPPEADGILSLENGVTWFSKQSISHLAEDADSYQTIGIQTSVGGMVEKNEMIYWSDKKSGLLYRNIIP